MQYAKKFWEIAALIVSLIVLIYLCLSDLLAVYNHLPPITPTIKAVTYTPTPKPKNTTTSTPTPKPTNTATSTPTPKPTNTATPIPPIKDVEQTSISAFDLLLLSCGVAGLILIVKLFLTIRAPIHTKPETNKNTEVFWDSIDIRSFLTKFLWIGYQYFYSPPQQKLASHHIRLDTATPETVITSQAFDLAAAIRELESPQIKEDGLSNVKVAQGLVYHHLDQKTVKYKVEVESPDCDIPIKSKIFLLDIGRDSEVQYFQLVPKREGKISIHINAYQIDTDDLIVANTRTQVTSIVESKATGEIREQLTREMVTRQLAIKKKIRIALSEYFNNDDIAVICHDAGIDRENLKGDTKMTKAISIIEYFEHRGEISQLIKIVKEVRPNVDID